VSGWFTVGGNLAVSVDRVQEDKKCIGNEVGPRLLMQGYEVKRSLTYVKEVQIRAMIKENEVVLAYRQSSS
jgi:hypothetical protein